MIDTDDLVLEIEKLAGFKCTVCGSEMGIASSGRDGTFVACKGEGADFMGKHWATQEYREAQDHYRHSRKRITSDGQSMARQIISIIKHRKRRSFARPWTWIGKPEQIMCCFGGCRKSTQQAASMAALGCEDFAARYSDRRCPVHRNVLRQKYCP